MKILVVRNSESETDTSKTISEIRRVGHERGHTIDTSVGWVHFGPNLIEYDALVLVGYNDKTAYISVENARQFLPLAPIAVALTSSVPDRQITIPSGRNFTLFDANADGEFEQAFEFLERSQVETSGISGDRNAAAVTSLGTLVVAWSPEVLSPAEYAELIAAIGDLARVQGAAGIQRILSETVGVTADVGVLT